LRKPDFTKATRTELLTVMYWDVEATAAERDAATCEFVRREQAKQRKPPRRRRLQQKMKKVYPR
jgi:hypothetical protein